MASPSRSGEPIKDVPTPENDRTIARAPMLDEALTLAVFDPGELRRQRILAPLARDERLLVTIEELQRIKQQRYRS